MDLIRYENIVKKYYSNEFGKFYIVKSVSNGRKTEEYDNFDDFYIACNGDLTGADLYDFDFKELNLKNYNLKEAILSSNIECSADLYSKEFERDLEKKCKLANLEILEDNLIETTIIDKQEISFNYNTNENIYLGYISDLHLEHRLKNKFPNSINKHDFERFMEQLVMDIKKDIPSKKFKIIFLGDICHSTYLLKIFLDIYNRLIKNETYVILGNHEFWDEEANRKAKSVDDIISYYRDIYKYYWNIKLLENDMVIFNSLNDKKILNLNDILKLTEDYFKKIYDCNNFVLFGGCGFAGLSETFNANNGIYKSSLITREVEIKKSATVSMLHQFLVKNTPKDKQVIFATHMTFSDWSNEEYNSEWIYLSGHTHINKIDLVNKRIYSDNQIGYTNNCVGLKYIVQKVTFDYFSNYKDGIHEITLLDYKIYYLGINQKLNYNKDNEKIYLLKKNKYHMFFIKDIKGKYQLLNGGSHKKTNFLDLEYYFNNLDKFVGVVHDLMKEYKIYLENISIYIKSIGGTGKIHGSIVDIDFYNHLFVSPLNGVVVPYHAETITNKHVYINLVSLLKSIKKNKLMYKQFITNKIDKMDNQLMILNNDLVESSEYTVVKDTSMYKLSRIIRSLQYITDSNTIRIWIPTLLDENITNKWKIIEKCRNNDYYEYINKVIEPLSQAHISYQKKIDIASNKQIQVIAYYNSINKANGYYCNKCNYIWLDYDQDLASNFYKCPVCNYQRVYDKQISTDLYLDTNLIKILKKNNLEYINFHVNSDLTLLDEYIDVTFNRSNDLTTPTYALVKDDSEFSIYTSKEKIYLLGDVSSLFRGITNDFLDLSKFDTSNVTNMSNMFSDCESLTTLDLSSFDTSNAKDMSYMFDNCKSLTTLDLSSFDTRNVKDMNYMFSFCKSLTTLDLSYFDTSNIDNIWGMFNGVLLTAVGYKQPKTMTYSWMNPMLLNFDNYNKYLDVVKFRKIFRKAQEINFHVNVDISLLGDSINITMNHDINSGFPTVVYLKRAEGIYDIYTSHDKIYVIDNISNMFSSGRLVNKLDLSMFDTSKVTDMSNMFYGSSNITTLDLSNFDTSKVTDMSNMFFGSSNITTLDLSNFDTSNVTNMSKMFYGCSNITTLDLSNFDTSKVTNMSNMFYGCSNITTLDLSNFDTSKVTDMNGMFFDCTNIINLDLSTFYTNNVNDMGNMFRGCKKLKELNLSSFTFEKLEYCTYIFNSVKLEKNRYFAPKLNNTIWKHPKVNED